MICTNMAEMQFKDADSVATVDLGFVRPIQVCTLRATQLDMDATAVARAAECWHIEKCAWMQQSGRDASNETERPRREVNPRYGGAIDEMSATRRRCSDDTLFDAYAQVAMATWRSEAKS